MFQNTFGDGDGNAERRNDERHQAQQGLAPSMSYDRKQQESQEIGLEHSEGLDQLHDVDSHRIRSIEEGVAELSQTQQHPCQSWLFTYQQTTYTETCENI